MHSTRRILGSLSLCLGGALVAGAGVSACSSSSSSATSTSTTKATTPTSDPTPAAGQFSRTILAQSNPENAPGQTLYLQRVDFGPHTTLALHHHEGIQESTMIAGELSYTVTSGSAGLRRASGSTTTIEAGSTVTLKPGDTLIEYPTTIHKGANDTDKGVELIIASLLAAGAPLSTPN